MNYDVEIAVLKAKVDALEDEFLLLYETLNKRVDDMQASASQKFTIWGIAASIVIGIVQIVIALLK